MPSPQVKQGDADAHRQPDSQQTTPDDPPTQTDGGSTDDGVEVQATGGDPDDPDDPDDGFDQAHGGDDDGGSFLTNKTVIAVVVVLAVVGLYLAAKQAEGGSGNANGGGSRKTASSPEEIDEALASANAPEGRNHHIPKDDGDPLAADGYVLENTSIFPSISGRGGD